LAYDPLEVSCGRFYWARGPSWTGVDAELFFRRLRGDLVRWACLRARTIPGSLLAGYQRQLSPSMPCRI